MAARIDANDPLYVHPSDTPGLSLITEQLTGSENYSIWSRAMLIGLRAKNKIAFIDGSCKCPESGSTSLLQWERCNAVVLSWILNAVSKDIFGGIVYSSDAFAVWTDLKERFDKVNGSRIFSIHREIGRLMQGSCSISACYSKHRQLWDEFACLVPLPTCDCESARKYTAYDQQHKLLQFLMGLSDSYAHVRSQILIMTPLPSVDQAYALITQEEAHRSLMASASPTFESSTSAFYSAQGKFDDKRKDSVVCEHCYRPGHTKASCFKLIGYPPGHKLYKGTGKNGNPKFNRDWNKNAKPQVNALLSNTESGNSLTAEPTSSVGALFTPEQYAGILELLDKSRASDIPPSPMVNMAGPMQWEDSGDW